MDVGGFTFERAEGVKDPNMSEGVGVNDGGESADLIADSEALGLGAKGTRRGRCVDCDGVDDVRGGRGSGIDW